MARQRVASAQALRRSQVRVLLPPLRPRVAQLRRAPLLQRGGWGFESLAADCMPLKLSSAEQPPCKRTVVGSIPTWGSRFPS
jgi:hypothetical protein